MKFRFFVYILPLVLCFGCTDSPQQTKPHKNKIENEVPAKRKPSSSFSDTLKIDSIAAVFYSPDSLQHEKIKLNTNARAIEQSMHEYFYLMRNAHLVIKKYYPQLKIIEAKDVRYLLFTRTNKNTDCIDLDTKNDAYGLFIFDPKKTPQVVDMANIDTELGFYFSK
jgi:hypothetical protein